MRIEISDKQYWIDKCNKAIANIQAERLKRQQYWENQSWWYRLCKDRPIKCCETITNHSWNTSGEWEINDLKKKLELPNCGAVEINPYMHDLNYVLNWAE